MLCFTCVISINFHINQSSWYYLHFQDKVSERALHLSKVKQLNKREKGFKTNLNDCKTCL